MKEIYVVTCRDHDGYYIPILAAFSRTIAKRKGEQWRLQEINNTYWDKEFIECERINLHEEVE